MKSIIIYLFLLLISTFKSTSQSLIKCGDNISFWLITDNSINYAVKLNGDISYSNMSDLINIEERVLQYTIQDKIHFIDENKNTNEIAILSNYVTGEAKHLLDEFSKPFNIEMHISKLPSGKPFLLWWYKVPYEENKEVVAQFFVNIIVGDVVFGLGSPQFTDDDTESTKVFLIETINTLSIVKNKNTLCN